jgi:hypothetical protein
LSKAISERKFSLSSPCSTAWRLIYVRSLVIS